MSAIQNGLYIDLKATTLRRMFFFFSQGAEAAAAFKDAIKRQDITYQQFGSKVGISTAALGKFVAGRPLSPKLMIKLLAGFVEEDSQRILVGHLRDEIRRANKDPNSFHIAPRQHGLIVSTLDKQLEGNPDRLAEVVAMMDRWEKTGKTLASG